MEGLVAVADRVSPYSSPEIKIRDDAIRVRVHRKNGPQRFPYSVAGFCQHEEFDVVIICRQRGVLEVLEETKLVAVEAKLFLALNEEAGEDNKGGKSERCEQL